jgi:hypothetical protein
MRNLAATLVTFVIAGARRAAACAVPRATTARMTLVNRRGPWALATVRSVGGALGVRRNLLRDARRGARRSQPEP